MKADGEAGNNQDSDNRYPEHEAKFHSPSLRLLRVRQAARDGATRSRASNVVYGTLAPFGGPSTGKPELRAARFAFINTMNKYTIQRAGHGYRVRVTDRNWHVVTGFGSEQEAEEWVAEQIKIELRDPNRPLTDH
jgi:hypothetical protein